MARLIDRRRTIQVVDYSKKFLTIVSLEDSNVIKWRTNDSSLKRTIYVSTDDGATWGQVTSSTSGATLATLNEGDRLLIKYASSAAYSTGSYYCYFSSTKNFKVEGNIMSLTTDGDFSTIDTVDAYAFKYLFADCTKLKDASNLILPATTLAAYCYERMFSGCSGMETGPKILPATTLTTSCYSYMFSRCTSLTTAPEILATNLGSSSQNMGQCRYMFSGCSSLNKIKCLAVNNITTYNLQSWVNGVA